MLAYAGIGSRKTPANILEAMTRIASQLADQGWLLHSGGAQGADQAFAKGAREKAIIYLPWDGFQGQHIDPLANPDLNPSYVVLEGMDFLECKATAMRIHPRSSRLSGGAVKLHARNVAIIEGTRHSSEVKAVICWTPRGKIVGGTGQGLRQAKELGIPIYNLATLNESTLMGYMASLKERN